ncbi:MAG TPA: Rieske 2Fe-2S domain-containing protein [Ohtaekwangia sp.]|nr:Rieske 2Fe-2S domain-containing protein [Ohtaekwangia sp.]
MDWIKLFSSIEEAKEKVEENGTRLIIIGGKRVCLARFNNRFFAVQDKCTHNGESLSRGKLNYQGEIICPWHNYRFDLETGRACDSTCRDLETYALRIDETGFFIGM